MVPPVDANNEEETTASTSSTSTISEHSIPITITDDSSSDDDDFSLLENDEDYSRVSSMYSIRHRILNIDYYLDHTWKCLLMLDYYVCNLRVKIGNKPVHTRIWRYDGTLSLPGPDFTIPHGICRSLTSIYSSSAINVIARITARQHSNGYTNILNDCLCNAVNVYRNYVNDHLNTVSRRIKCECESNCTVSGRLECRNSLDTAAWLLNELSLNHNHLYCFRHARSLYLRTEMEQLVNIFGDDTPCEMIMEGVCYHTAIQLLYENRTLYGSDLHKALALWVRYQENRSRNRIVMTYNVNCEPSSFGIYYGFIN